MESPVKKWFEGRRLLIATKHGKEAVIAPILERALGVTCVVPDDYDTDQFGTFTSEIRRESDPLETARQKCETAMQLYDFDLGIASEGSFGAHPAIGFLPCDEELLVLIDKKNDLQIVEKAVSLETNTATGEITDETALLDFAQYCRFPSHGLVLSVPGTDQVSKGIHDTQELIAAFQRYKCHAGSVRAETDMRAMHNPTRMKVIEQAAIKLAGKIKSLCPVCDCPGFGITGVVPGLPCEMCDRPTKSARAYTYSCSRCVHNTEVPKPEDEKEDPTFCDYCNP